MLLRQSCSPLLESGWSSSGSMCHSAFSFCGGPIPGTIILEMIAMKGFGPVLPLWIWYCGALWPYYFSISSTASGIKSGRTNVATHALPPWSIANCASRSYPNLKGWRWGANPGHYHSSSSDSKYSAVPYCSINDHCFLRYPLSLLKPK